MYFFDINGNKYQTGTGNVNISQASPIAGKKICMVGDSNIQLFADEHKAYMEETYGCTFVPFGTSACTWHLRGEGDELLVTTTSNKSAVGKINQILANVDENGLITEYDYIVICMGTNDWAFGALTDTSADPSTTCGAVRYCLEKLCLHGRNINIGVVLPIRSNRKYVDSTMPQNSKNIRDIAHEYGVPVLDMYNEGRVIGDFALPDATNAYLQDGLHLGEYGRKRFDHILGKWIAYSL